MSIYAFPAQSPVRQVAFSHAGDRPPVALLEAPETISADQVSTIRRAMESSGWTCVPAVVDGKGILQVDGFANERQLLGFMERYQFSKGQPEYTPEPGDNKKLTTGEWVRGNALKLAGGLNLIGDATLLGAGLVNRRTHEIIAGGLYTAGAGVLTRYANVKTEHHVREVLEETAEFLKKQAVNLPEDCGLFSILKEKRQGLLPNAERFMYHYPSEVMLGAYTLGAMTMLQSGFKQKNPWGIAYGASSVGVKAASLLVPEKRKDPAEKKNAASPIGSLAEWIQEKPLRIFGFGNMVSDVLLGLSAMREYKSDKNQLGSILKFTTSGAYVLADVLFAMSNKDHANTAEGKFDPDEQRRIEAMVAETIARQPKELQSALVNNAAGFLATHPEMQGTALTIAESIAGQLHHIKHNPWASRSESTSAAVSPPANR